MNLYSKNQRRKETLSEGRRLSLKEKTPPKGKEKRDEGIFLGKPSSLRKLKEVLSQRTEPLASGNEKTYPLAPKGPGTTKIVCTRVLDPSDKAA